jgi:hypothetical protein
MEANIGFGRQATTGRGNGVKSRFYSLAGEGGAILCRVFRLVNRNET